MAKGVAVQHVPKHQRMAGRLEQFCLNVASGMSIAKASNEAGFHGNGTYAYKLVNKPHVQERIAQLRKGIERERLKMQAKMELPTREKVLADLVSVVDAAREAKDRTSQLRGLELIGKEIGMFIQRSAVEVNSPLNGLPVSILQQFVAAIASGAEFVIEGTAEAENAERLISEQAHIEAEPGPDDPFA